MGFGVYNNADCPHDMNKPLSPLGPESTAHQRHLPPAASGKGLRELIRDPLNFFQSITTQYGDIVCYRPAPDPAYLINHPDFVRHVLLDNNRNYSKATQSNLIFNKLIGEGLLTSEGEIWRQQRPGILRDSRDGIHATILSDR